MLWSNQGKQISLNHGIPFRQQDSLRSSGQSSDLTRQMVKQILDIVSLPLLSTWNRVLPSDLCECFCGKLIKAVDKSFQRVFLWCLNVDDYFYLYIYTIQKELCKILRKLIKLKSVGKGRGSPLVFFVIS